MNKKLRLLITTKCYHNCLSCCNKQYDMLKIPVYDFKRKYSEVYITGGEPLLAGQTLTDVLSKIPDKTKQVILYTAEPIFLISHAQNYDISRITGLTITIHNNKDLESFIIFLLWFNTQRFALNYIKSNRLKVFQTATNWNSLHHALNLSRFAVTDGLYYIENCPVPQDEDFKRIENI